MNEVIMPNQFLVRLDQDVNDLIVSIKDDVGIDCSDPEYGLAFRRYLLFSYWPYLLEKIGFRATNEDIFYNRYYWMLVFAKLYERKHGFDAGIEQQTFKILEGANIDIDWNVVEQLTNLVDIELGDRP